jgi:hypothetical protein
LAVIAAAAIRFGMDAAWRARNLRLPVALAIWIVEAAMGA